MTPVLDVPTADAMYDVGLTLAGHLRPGDLVLLTGPLGAGKTTLAAGVGQGLDVRGRPTSPTFVIAREHPPLKPGGAWLVHVDAYRLAGWAELEDLDLTAAAEQAVTLVEWGHGLAEDLSGDRLEVLIDRPEGVDPDDETRQLRLIGTGDRWPADTLDALNAALARSLSGQDGAS